LGEQLMRVLALVFGLLGSLGAAVGIMILFAVGMATLAQHDETLSTILNDPARIAATSGEVKRLADAYGGLEKVPPSERQAYQERSLQYMQPIGERQAEITEPYVPRLFAGLGFALLGLVGTVVAVGKSSWGSRIILGAIGGLLLTAAWLAPMIGSTPSVAFGLVVFVPSIVVLGLSALLSLRNQRRTA
jgi:hypothetical protein